MNTEAMRARALAVYHKLMGMPYDADNSSYILDFGTAVHAAGFVAGATEEINARVKVIEDARAAGRAEGVREERERAAKTAAAFAGQKVQGSRGRYCTVTSNSIAAAIRGQP